jgi:hypothetical protein
MNWTEWQSREPLLFQTAVAHVVLAVLCVGMMMVDGAEITGINRWVKPMKFCVSIALYLGSMAWYWPVAQAGAGAKRVAAMVLAGTLVLEMVWIFVQAGRGVRSHFNVTSAMDGMAFQMAGAVILINIAVAGLVCYWTFRGEGTAYVWGVRLGLLSFVLFALEGIVMVRKMGHAVGVADGGPGLPVVNWSTEGGDLRIAHFLGMHALQILPLVGVVTRSVPAVAVAFAIWGALSVAALWRALSGRPLVSW